EQFYNMEDVWEIPKERFAGKEQLVEPYYVVMKLPGEDRERFMLMLPFTPRQKSNMIAWMAAHCDPDDYGKMTVFRFPKGRLIFGPIQVEARIDQDPRISEYLTLWSQRGSQVIRGNLLVIPVAASVLYVEPLYLQAEQNQIPQLKKVIVASSKRVVMANNLWDALEQLLRAGGDKGGTTTLALQQEQIKTASSGAKEPTDRYIQQLIDRVWSHIQQFERARRDGDWAGMEREWSSIKRILRQLRSSARKGS
ncbi:MAG TPA: UPF0182 family protein, partial [Armatimonadetes bacterium]|nr:UPF0182 family protein [Armatimonadota bacterium]